MPPFSHQYIKRAAGRIRGHDFEAKITPEEMYLDGGR